MDIWHRLGRIIRFSNIGTLIFFCLNIAIILDIFGGTQETGTLLLFYFLTVAVSLSPVGEWILCALAGAENIKRTDIKIQIIPLVETVLDAAQSKTMYHVSKVTVKIIHDQAPNAFALGRHTLAVTDGLLELPDEIILSVLAHEVGHLAYGHSVIQLLIGGGNVFIAGCLLLFKAVCWMITGLMGICSFAARSWLLGILTVFFAGISYVFTWVWVRFCRLFLMWSMRQNEFTADAYAAKLGFGYGLAYALDHSLCDMPHNGVLDALYHTHPGSDDRIAALQKLGVMYSR